MYRLAAAAGLMVALAGAFVARTSSGPAVGDQAPSFVLAGSDGRVHRLQDYRNHQVVVLAWFPKAYTHGCTLECKSLAEHSDLIRKYDVAYFMVSVDAVEDTEGFAAEEQANFPLLADPSKETAKSYGVLNPVLRVASRRTFYIGRDGRILAIDRDVHPATSAQDMAAKLRDLGVPERR
jgi:peroxiredoxin Q/BCP